MPIDNDARALLDEQLEQLKGRFEEFRSARRDYQDTIRRRFSPNLPQSLKDYGNKFEVQSDILESDLQENVAIRLRHTPKISLTSLEDTKDAKKDVEEIEIWNASWMLRDNNGRVSDRAILTDQQVLGVSVTRVLATMPKEPETGDDEDEEGASFEAQRRQHFMKATESTFRELHRNPLTMLWGPNLSDPDLYFEDAEVTLIEARKSLRNDQGHYPTLDAAGKVAFLGEGEPLYGEHQAGSSERLHFVRRNMRDPKSGKWTATEFVYPHGSNATSDWDQLTEYVIPTERAEYYVIPAGGEQLNETDPHLRYPPGMKPLIVAVTEHNFWSTVLGQLALRAVTDEKIYIPLRGTPDESVKAFLAHIGDYGHIEGVGAQQTLVVTPPKAGSGEMLVLPGLEPWPKPTIDEILTRLSYLENVEIPQYRPNRFLSGAAFEETKSSTGTGLLAQMEAAGIAPQSDLDMIDLYREEQVWARKRAILFWDKEVEGPRQKLYPLVTTGKEAVAKGKIDPGKQIVITAEKMQRNFAANVKTESFTEQQRLLRDQEATAKFERGLFSLPQYLERLGFDDPENQMRELNRERHRVEAQAQFAPLEQAERQALYAALSGLSVEGLAALIAPPMGPGADVGPGGGGGAPTPMPNAGRQVIEPPQFGRPAAGVGV
ncbi:MAG: hypothetical protein GEU71_12100 [Actinobacteria bacterium]|nr:hypothetical protein [Actinomycetota bacterium]